jgi:dTDP-4-dehydrorhamnose reductase
MNVLLTGASGQLGTELARRGPASRHALSAVDQGDLDFARPDGIAAWIAARRPEAVVNTAAYTQVDRAESEPELAFAVNARAPREIARACRDLGIPLIHISTDYVFDGSRRTPYAETDPVCPVNVYGRSKAEGEAGVRALLDRHIIVRTAWLYSAVGANFLKTMVRLARERDELRVVCDQTGAPTRAADLAAAILRILDRIESGAEVPWGTYHFVGAGETTWFGFAERIVGGLAAYHPAPRARVVPITTAEYPTAARRPAYSVLDCRLIAERFGIIPPPWGPGVAETLRELLSGPTAAPAA